MHSYSHEFMFVIQLPLIIMISKVSDSAVIVSKQKHHIHTSITVKKVPNVLEIHRIMANTLLDV